MPKRLPVSGTVTLDGQPLAEGVIYFKTIEKGSSEPCDIQGGEFKGQAEAGDRRVEICQFRTTVQDANGMKTEIQENLIPARYNTESTLTAKVTPAGPNQFKFELIAK